MGQCLNRKIDNITTIEKEVKAWQNHRNNKECKINWRFTYKDARIKLKKLYLARLLEEMSDDQTVKSHRV